MSLLFFSLLASQPAAPANLQGGHAAGWDPSAAAPSARPSAVAVPSPCTCPQQGTAAVALSAAACPPAAAATPSAFEVAAAAAAPAAAAGWRGSSLLLERRRAAVSGSTGGSFSSYKCLGGHDLASASNSRSCIFHDVCHVSGGGLRLQFYVDPREPRQPVTSEGGVEFGFGPGFVAAGPYLQSGFSQAWSPELTPGPRPSTFAVHPAPIAVAFQSHVEANFAEWTNVMIHIFGQQALHGLQPLASKTLLLELDPRERSRKFRAAMLPLLSAHEPLDLRSAGDVCFQSVIVGAGHLDVLEMGKWGSFILEPLRDTILQGMGLPPPPPPLRHSVVIVQKNVKSGNLGRHIVNHGALVADIAAHFASIADVASLLPDELSVREQLEIIQAATVIITPPGGGGFISFFAQPGAAVIFVDVMHDGRSQRYPQLTTGGLEDAMWTHLASMEKLHYPICAGEAMAGGSEADLFVQPTRMRHYVYLAMKRAERHLPSIASRDTRRDGVEKFREPDMCKMTSETAAEWEV